MDYSKLGWELLYKGFVKLWKSSKGMMVLEATDSVNFLVYDRVNKRVLLTKQWRDPMIREDNPDGMLIEVAGGRFDYKIGPRGLFKAEAFEELGVTLDESSVEFLNGGKMMALSAGVLSEQSYLAYVEVSPKQIEAGNKVYGVGEHEVINRIFMTIDEFEKLVCQDVKTFALKEWFLRVKLPQLEKE